MPICVESSKLSNQPECFRQLHIPRGSKRGACEVECEHFSMKINYQVENDELKLDIQRPEFKYPKRYKDEDASSISRERNRTYPESKRKMRRLSQNKSDSIYNNWVNKHINERKESQQEKKVKFILKSKDTIKQSREKVEEPCEKHLLTKRLGSTDLHVNSKDEGKSQIETKYEISTDNLRVREARVYNVLRAAPLVNNSPSIEKIFRREPRQNGIEQHHRNPKYKKVDFSAQIETINLGKSNKSINLLDKAVSNKRSTESYCKLKPDIQLVQSSYEKLKGANNKHNVYIANIISGKRSDCKKGDRDPNTSGTRVLRSHAFKIGGNDENQDSSNMFRESVDGIDVVHTRISKATRFFPARPEVHIDSIATSNVANCKGIDAIENIAFSKGEEPCNEHSEFEISCLSLDTPQIMEKRSSKGGTNQLALEIEELRTKYNELLYQLKENGVMNQRQSDLSKKDKKQKLTNENIVDNLSNNDSLNNIKKFYFPGLKKFIKISENRKFAVSKEAYTSKVRTEKCVKKQLNLYKTKIHCNVVFYEPIKTNYNLNFFCKNSYLKDMEKFPRCETHNELKWKLLHRKNFAPIYPMNFIKHECLKEKPTAAKEGDVERQLQSSFSTENSTYNDGQIIKSAAGDPQEGIIEEGINKIASSVVIVDRHSSRKDNRNDTTSDVKTTVRKKCSKIYLPSNITKQSQRGRSSSLSYKNRWKNAQNIYICYCTIPQYESRVLKKRNIFYEDSVNKPAAAFSSVGNNYELRESKTQIISTVCNPSTTRGKMSISNQKISKNNASLGVSSGKKINKMNSYIDCEYDVDSMQSTSAIVVNKKSSECQLNGNGTHQVSTAVLVKPCCREIGVQIYLETPPSLEVESIRNPRYIIEDTSSYLPSSTFDDEEITSSSATSNLKKISSHNIVSVGDNACPMTKETITSRKAVEKPVTAIISVDSLSSSYGAISHCNCAPNPVTFKAKTATGNGKVHNTICKETSKAFKGTCVMHIVEFRRNRRKLTSQKIILSHELNKLIRNI